MISAKKTARLFIKTKQSQMLHTKWRQTRALTTKKFLTTKDMDKLHQQIRSLE